MNNLEIPALIDSKVDFTSTDETSLLVIIIDSNPSQKMIRDNPSVLTHCVESIIAFANSHLMQKAQNQLAVMACHSRNSEFIYPASNKASDVRQIDGQYEVFTAVEKTIKQNLAKLLANEKSTFATESLLAGAIAMALCYIARVQRTKPPGALLNNRVLVITGSGDSASQYMNYMNVFFTAQKQGIVIDVCALDQHLSLLQQGCDITGGLYLKLPQLQGLLQYLLWVFLPEPPVRQKLVLPPPVKVDYRAACFCHRELIDIGYVCSVCLSNVPIHEPGKRQIYLYLYGRLGFLNVSSHSWSQQDTQVLNLSLDVAAYDIFVESQDQHINKCHQNSAITFFLCLSLFCKFSPICTTCHTVFKIPGPLATKSKKKKIKL